jgi:hypothetical protein
MALIDEIESLLETFGVSAKEDLQQALRDKGVTFGGNDSKLSDKIQYKINKTTTGINFKLILPDYAEYVDNGREQGNVSEVGQKSIEKWVQRKGIVGGFQSKNLEARLKKQSENKSNRKKKTLSKIPFDKASKAFAYLISRKLKTKRLQGNHFYTETITTERVNKLRIALTNLIKTDVTIEIKGLTDL